jgi:hypothetical protein
VANNCLGKKAEPNLLSSFQQDTRSWGNCKRFNLKVALSWGLIACLYEELAEQWRKAVCS